ncbi:MAG: TIGR04283 family arsenosugar biosynthesis glycosyltransferase [Bryobacterales bacterium]|nr:TIGR04283 family arsenosugar biosynthesis glycosyltransferase [Bryobacterales bacterium]
MITVSVLIPTLNEESTIEPLLQRLASEAPFEILVADGGSTDRTAQLAAPHAAVLSCPRGRGPQLNHAARAARGDVLLFLHADVRPAPSSLAAIRQALADPSVAGGNFDILYEGNDTAARVFSWINRRRCRFGIFYGDSGIFCRRRVFHHLGGFRDIPILEDYEFGRRLWKHGRFLTLPHPIHVSARRWRKAGLFPTLWVWFWIQALYLSGVSPRRLSRMYRDVR